MSFLILVNKKSDSYDLILVIIHQLIKMIYYKPIKVTIDVLSLVKVIINMVLCYFRVLESIIMERSLLFISKFWFLLYYFLKIKKTYLQLLTYKQIARLRHKTV